MIRILVFLTLYGFIASAAASDDLRWKFEGNTASIASFSADGAHLDIWCAGEADLEMAVRYREFVPLETESGGRPMQIVRIYPTIFAEGSVPVDIDSELKETVAAFVPGYLSYVFLWGEENTRRFLEPLKRHRFLRLDVLDQQVFDDLDSGVEIIEAVKKLNFSLTGSSASIDQLLAYCD